jgi:uncharacterized membrane protein (DUF106 family)
MKAYKKIMFVMLIVLVAVSALGLFAGQANAALNSQGTISTDNPSVAQVTSYSLTITNTGTDRLLSANITVPQGVTNIADLAVNLPNWSISYNDAEQIFNIYLTQTGDGLNNGASIIVTFNAKNPDVAGNYLWVIDTVGTNGTTESMFSLEITSSAHVTTMVPVFILLGIAIGISTLSLGFNRILISHFIGWEQFHVMRREMDEFRKEQMAAARANDQKQMEKLKRKQSQINNMQAKMMKPTLLQFVFAIVPYGLWIFVLIPTFGSTSLAYLPGFGPIPMSFIYLPLSFFVSTIGQRIIGLNPIR